LQASRKIELAKWSSSRVFFVLRVFSNINSTLANELFLLPLSAIAMEPQHYMRSPTTRH
jgi:hypothetical protein